jgi:OmpA-OmpF porin, OOP family
MEGGKVMINSGHMLVAVAVSLLFGLSLAHAADVKVLGGVPTSGQLEDALAPAPAKEPPRFRSLSLGGAPPTPAVAAKPPAPPAPVAVSIQFDSNSDRLTREGQTIVDNLAAALKSDRLKTSRFRIEGHTDGVGSDALNDALSARRAKAVSDYLSKTHGIEPERLVAVGKGKRELIDPANPASGANRRVQLVNLGS